jgi:hypothetical protein
LSFLSVCHFDFQGKIFLKKPLKVLCPTALSVPESAEHGGDYFAV